MKTRVFNPPNNEGKVWVNVNIDSIEGFDGAEINVGLFVDDIDSKAAWTAMATAQAIDLLRRAVSDHDAQRL